MKENVAAEILMGTEDTVGGVGIADVQAEKEIALRIKPVKFVEAFRYLLVAEAALWAEDSR